MKKCTLMLLFAMATCLASYAQCPGPIVLATQADVNAFPTNWPNCTHPNGRFEIGAFNGSSNITDLTPLEQITGFGNHTYIHFNPNLTSLNGLENVTEVLGDFTIQANHALTNLQGLNGLTNTPALLKIENNNGLQTLDGLTPGAVLTDVASVVIIENDALTDLSDVLDALQTVSEYVYIQDNASLPTLNTMNNLISIGQYLNIDDHPSLTSLNAFASLQTVGTSGAGWDLEVLDCPQLTTLNEFGNLTTVGKNLEISGNTDLSEMSFPSLASIGGQLVIVANTSLTSLMGLGDFTLNGPLAIVGNTSLPECETDGICDYLEGPGQATITGNAAGCNTIAQIEAACLLLPVELVYFRGTESEGEMHLTWQTASEKDNAHFQVEHSVDGSAFTPVGKVEGKGTSVIPTDYSFRHTRPNKGKNYYRLRQVDFDGTFAFSPIVHIETGRALLVETYPNPTTGLVILKGDFPEGTARLLDINGRPIMEKQLPDGRSFDLSRMPKGVYLIEIQVNNERIIKRVVKE